MNVTEFSKDYQPPTRGTPEDLTKGRQEKKLMTDALMVALKRVTKDAEGKPTKNINAIASKLVDNAKGGDNKAIDIIFDRTEGKAAQALTLMGDEENPLVSKIVMEIIE